MPANTNPVEVLRRIATISEKKAREELFAKHPDAEILKMTTVHENGTDWYETTIRVAGPEEMPMDPPLDGPVGENAPEAPLDGPELPGEEDHEGDSDKHLLHKLEKKIDALCKALGVTDEPEEDPLAEGDHGDAAVPGGDPLPPPAVDPAGGADLGGGQAFSSLDPEIARELQAYKELGKSIETKYAKHRSAVLVVDNADQMNNVKIVDRLSHATSAFRVASIDRDSKKSANQAVIALIRNS